MATTHVNNLNSLLRGEISATETYNQALEKFAGSPEETEIRRMRDEHREAANALRQQVHEHDAEPSTGSGWWGSWAKFVEGTSQVFGKAASLKALKEGEEHGLEEYKEVLRDDSVNDACKGMIRERFLPECQAHVHSLDRLIDAQ